MIEGGHGAHALDQILVYRDGAGDITGAIYYGAQLALATEDAAAIDAFAVETRRHPGMRSFVGPTGTIEALWERVRAWHRPPVIVRAHQPIYALSADTIVAVEPLDVRLATTADADAVIANSAEMMLVELGYDPRVNRSSFGAGVRRAIAQGLWWVYIDDGELKFQLNVGARTNATAQLQGVWTPPAHRKHGYARRALGTIATRLLQTNPTLSLYVNDFNRDAITLYERVGFACVGELSTLLFA